ncbi:MAG: hypothetical protein V4710_19070 [Verrucomicrobiota bacterium]
MPKEVRIHVRIDEALKDDMQRLKKATGLDDAAIVRACLESVVEYFNEHEEITLPLVIMPKSTLKKLKGFFPAVTSSSVPAAGSSTPSTHSFPADQSRGIHRVHEDPVKPEAVHRRDAPPLVKKGGTK